MLTTRPAGRALVTVGGLALTAGLVLDLLPVTGSPPPVALMLLAAAAGALIAALVGAVHVGFLLANGTQGAPGLAGPARWGRAACIAAGIGQVVGVAVAAVDAQRDGRAGGALAPAWDACLALLVVLAAVAVARGGALRGSARWALALPAAVQAAIAVVGLVAGPAHPVLPTVLAGIVLPATLVVAGAAFLRAAGERPRAASDPTLRTRLGRTTGEWEVRVPTAAAVAHLRGFVAQQSRFTLVRLNEATAGADAELYARTNWAAWGGRIVLRLESLDDGTTRVHGRWNPARVTAVLTWDQGERDLQRLAAGLATGAAQRAEPVGAAPR